MDANETGAASLPPSSSGSVAEAVARVVAAYASRPDTTPDEIVSLTLKLCEVFGAAATAPRPNTPAPAVLSPRSATDAPVPALPIEQAVTADKVYCLCCGRGFTMLKRHIKAEHGLTEEDYRALYALPEDMPLVAPNYSERKAAYAKRVGLGRYQRDTADEDTPTR
ncbi:MucR family transcriptional regulator [Antarcticimicrobium sediminis]|uniref:MucR family transcriptional regulator n=1 Tax=Antarcticimicrobium sediminis TaxID=2546227 RepID=A0A4R5EVG8_9RHOB|nr:MucR family transcriptional regulator [Antarcticimicrobium sediminis]TDE38871.1 MucR family transcriptional regulator [Antarcticimicrobium sediminis]